MFDDRTTRYSLALPHPSNQLDEDVARLRASLNQIDSLLSFAITKLASDDPFIDDFQGILDSLKPALLALSVIESPVASVFTYDASGRIASSDETLAGGETRVTVFTYNGDGTLNTETVSVGDASWVTTYQYLSGRVVGAEKVSV